MIVRARYYTTASIVGDLGWNDLVAVATTIDLARARAKPGRYPVFAEDISWGFGIKLALVMENGQRLTFKAFPEGMDKDSGAVWFEAWMSDARNVRRALGRTAERWIGSSGDKHPIGLVSLVHGAYGLTACLALVSGRKQSEGFGEVFSMPSSQIKSFAKS